MKLNQPYAGIFVKRDDDNQTEVVASMDELYSIGTFAQIVELQDLGSRLRMVLMAHRRILLTEQHVDESLVETPAVEVVESEEKPEVQVSSEEMEAREALKKAKLDKEPLLIGKTENVEPKDYTTTEEVKAMTQEVIKTIRDIIALNPLYRDSLQQMLQFGQRVVDNPVYLSDLGAALTGGETEELMKVSTFSIIVQNPEWTFTETIFTGTSIVFVRFTSQVSEIILCYLGDRGTRHSNKTDVELEVVEERVRAE